jgi:AraC family ethanolamine operon transcriptional activator
LTPDAQVAALPPSQPARTVVSADADELAEHLSAWDQTYEQLARGRFIGRLDELWLDGLQVFRERTSLDVLETGTPWRGSRTFGIPLAMEGVAVYCGKPMPPDMLLTLGPRDTLDLRAPRALDIVGLAWPADALRAFTQDLEGADIEEELRGRRLLPVAPAALASLRYLLHGVFALLDEDAARLADPQVARGLRCTLLETIVAAVRDAAGEPRESFTASVRHATVRRARDYALSRPDEPISVAELCAALRVSRRTLQTCFQDMLGMSPHQYLRTLRLNGMRRDLRSAPGGRVAVHQIAARWGFWHMSSCAADYRRLFGELPSASLRAARRSRD